MSISLPLVLRHKEIGPAQPLRRKRVQQETERCFGFDA